MTVYHPEVVDRAVSHPPPPGWLREPKPFLMPEVFGSVIQAVLTPAEQHRLRLLARGQAVDWLPAPELRRMWLLVDGVIRFVLPLGLEEASLYHAERWSSLARRLRAMQPLSAVAAIEEAVETVLDIGHDAHDWCPLAHQMASEAWWALFRAQQALGLGLGEQDARRAWAVSSAAHCATAAIGLARVEQRSVVVGEILRLFWQALTLEGS